MSVGVDGTSRCRKVEHLAGGGTAVTASPVLRGRQQTDKAFPVDTGQVLGTLLQRFEATPEPIPVSFRDLVPWIRMGERASHHIHTYPAKLLPQIAHFFLATTKLVGRDESVLDPFGGTATVALETILSGRNALYADVNPLARLIAKVKTRPVDLGDLEVSFISVKTNFIRNRSRRRPNVVNLDHWFDTSSISKLIRLKAAILALEDVGIRDFMLVTFSAALRKASLADPRFSVPVRRRDGASPRRCPDVWRLFEQQYQANVERLRNFARLRPSDAAARLCGEDARALRCPETGRRLPDGSVGMILTSPPYAGAQKYVRAASLSLGWLDMAGSGQLRPLEDATIGREHFPSAEHHNRLVTGIPDADELLDRVRGRNPSRALIAATYLVEMRAALEEAARVLRPGGYFVLVVGDNTVCGERFETSRYLQRMLHDLRLVTSLVLVDDIKSRGLMTRRAATAGVIASEHVMVFSKPQ
jgi:SAM-dependent methyltransferase